MTLAVDQLRILVDAGDVDTVVLAFTDMQGRLQGKCFPTAPRRATTCSPSTST
jgi:glutamine synthetase